MLRCHAQYRQRKNLLRFTPDSAPDRWIIEVLPTLRRIIPFQNIEEWTKNADRYLAAVRDSEFSEAEAENASDSGDEVAE